MDVKYSYADPVFVSWFEVEPRAVGNRIWRKNFSMLMRSRVG